LKDQDQAVGLSKKRYWQKRKTGTSKHGNAYLRSLELGPAALGLRFDLNTFLPSDTLRSRSD
jgi:hypothetical protein